MVLNRFLRSYIVYVKRVRALRIRFCLRLIVKVKQKNEQGESYGEHYKVQIRNTRGGGR